MYASRTKKGLALYTVLDLPADFDYDDAMQLTQSREDYLETIYELIEANAVARVKDIAAKLNVRKPSVHCAINELKKHGLVEQEAYGYVTLTEAGTVEAQKVVRRHEILREFLLLLGVPPEVAERDACAMEHILSPATYDAVERFSAEKRKTKHRPAS